MRGVPDMYVPAWALWIEMKKTSGSRVSPEQKDWHNYLREINGNVVIITAGYEDAKLQVENFIEAMEEESNGT